MAESASEDLTASGAESGGASVAWGLETSVGGVSPETGVLQSGNQGNEPAVSGRRAPVPAMELDGAGERLLDSTAWPHQSPSTTPSNCLNWDRCSAQ